MTRIAVMGDGARKSFRLRSEAAPADRAWLALAILRTGTSGSAADSGKPAQRRPAPFTGGGLGMPHGIGPFAPVSAKQNTSATKSPAGRDLRGSWVSNERGDCL